MSVADAAVPVSLPTVVKAAVCVIAPLVCRSRSAPPRSNAPVMPIALAIIVGDALPGCVTAPMRNVPAVMPVILLNDRLVALPSITGLAVLGASSNVPVAPAFARPVAPVTPRLARALVCSPTVPPATDAMVNAPNVMPPAEEFARYTLPVVAVTLPAMPRATESLIAILPVVAVKASRLLIAFAVPSSEALPATPALASAAAVMLLPATWLSVPAESIVTVFPAAAID